MRIAEPIETHGYFWLPDEPDHRLSGTLRISENGETSLELFGAFDSPFNRLRNRQRPRRLRILGITDKKYDVTLIDCIVTNQSDTVIGNIPLSKSSIHVGWVFSGIHFVEKEITFSSMSFSVEGLDEWFCFQHRPFSSTGDLRGSITLHYSAPEPIVVQLSDNLTIRMHMRAGQHSGLFDQTLTTKMSIQIDSSSKLLFAEFLEVMERIRTFICLALDQVLNYTFVAGLLQAPNEPSTPRDIVEIYTTFDAYDSPKQDIRLGHFLIPFQDVADNLGEYLRQWFDGYAEYEPTYNLYFAVASNRFMHLEGRLLFLVQGIESLHRRRLPEPRMPIAEFDSLVAAVAESAPSKWSDWLKTKLKYANEPSLRSRMNQMISPFNDLFGTATARKNFVNKVVNTRNYFTHYDNRIQDQAVTDPEALLQLTDKLEGLVQLRLLELLGMENEEIKNTAKRYTRLRRRLQIK